jgi:hypothetical protein
MMLKVKYSRVRLPCSIRVFGDVAAEKARLGRVQVARQSSAEVVLRLFIRRLIEPAPLV